MKKVVAVALWLLGVFAVIHLTETLYPYRGKHYGNRQIDLRLYYQGRRLP